MRYKYNTKTYFCFHQRVQVSILAFLFLPASSCELSLSTFGCFTICVSGHKLGQPVKIQLSQHRTVHSCTRGDMLFICLRHLVISLTGYHQRCLRQNYGSQKLKISFARLKWCQRPAPSGASRASMSNLWPAMKTL